MRVFSGRALTKADILKNYNHSLTGTEDGLFAYWPVDEGIYNQTTAYDYSKTSGVANGNHGQLGPSTTTSNTVLPTEHQFGHTRRAFQWRRHHIYGCPQQGHT